MKTMYVKAKGFDDPILINEEDFDEQVHAKLSAAAESKVSASSESAAVVTKTEKKAKE